MPINLLINANANRAAREFNFTSIAEQQQSQVITAAHCWNVVCIRWQGHNSNHQQAGCWFRSQTTVSFCRESACSPKFSVQVLINLICFQLSVSPLAAVCFSESWLFIIVIINLYLAFLFLYKTRREYRPLIVIRQRQEKGKQRWRSARPWSRFHLRLQ